VLKELLKEFLANQPAFFSLCTHFWLPCYQPFPHSLSLCLSVSLSVRLCLGLLIVRCLSALPTGNWQPTANKFSKASRLLGLRFDSATACRAAGGKEFQGREEGRGEGITITNRVVNWQRRHWHTHECIQGKRRNLARLRERTQFEPGQWSHIAAVACPHSPLHSLPSLIPLFAVACA